MEEDDDLNEVSINPDLNADGSINVGNQDWLRQRTWDLPTDLDQIRRLGIDPDKLLTLPAARVMPQSLREEIEAERRARSRREIVRGERSG